MSERKRKRRARRPISERERERRARQRAMSIAQFSQEYGIGRTKTYEELRSGRLRGRKSGKRTIITEDDAEEWVAASAHHRGRAMILDPHAVAPLGGSPGGRNDVAPGRDHNRPDRL